MFWILFLNFLGLSFEQYNDYCFKIWGTEKLIPLKFNSEIKLIPDILIIYTTIEEWTKYGKKYSHSSSMFISKSESKYCTEGLLIPNFMTKETDYLLISVEVAYEYFRIDDFKLKLYPHSETRNYRNYESFMGKLKISFYVSISEKKFRSYSHEGVVFSKKMVYAKDQKVLCMRFIDIEGEYIFMTENIGLKFKPFIINKFNTLEIGYGYKTRNYLVEIYECDKKSSYSPINILVDDWVKGIEIRLYNKTRKEVYKMKFIKENKEFVSETSLENNSKLFDVRVENELFEKAWERRKRSILLYNFNQDNRICVKKELVI